MNDIDKQKKIKEAAKAVFIEKGYSETKMSEIAAKASISVGTIYNYYKNKKDLFDSLELPELEAYRPEYEQRKQEILNASLKLFGEKGFSRTTMDDIASAKGLTKAALYQYFNSKEEILSSIVQKSDVRSLLFNLDNQAALGKGNSFIKEIGHEFLSMYSEPEKLNLLRIIICESSQFPELGQLIYKETIADAHHKVASYLEKINKSNGINSKFAAKTFLGMLLSFVVVDRLINNSSEEYSQEEIVTGVVDIFLNGIK